MIPEGFVAGMNWYLDRLREERTGADAAWATQVEITRLRRAFRDLRVHLLAKLDRTLRQGGPSHDLFELLEHLDAIAPEAREQV